MKKIILIIAILLFSISTLKAQKKISFGVKSGINLTNMTSDYSIPINGKTGFNIGIISEIALGERFSI